MKKGFYQIIAIAKREEKRILSRGLYTFCMVIAPVVAFLFFTTLMGEGLPAELPAGVCSFPQEKITLNTL